ncbi:MAG: serine hydrolase [Candidatus Magasanikbacteria bacterium]|nr:serine hydrolase [Candidatus Magasanikbacteria bacterium]
MRFFLSFLHKTTINFVIVLFLLISGFLFGNFYVGVQAKKDRPPRDNEVRTYNRGDYLFTNPLLECGDFNSLSNKTTVALKESVKQFVDVTIAGGEADQVSVYFRDLNNGPWFGLGEKEIFLPGSLLKVPLLMAILRKAEDNPTLLNRRFLNTRNRTDIIEHFSPAQEIEPGKSYAVQELLQAMIKYSDNNATSLLTRVISEKDIKNIYLDLGIDIPQSNQYSMSVRTYASFFRILFNATYFSRRSSEDALRLLSETDFKQGIVLGVPAGVTVAHKFGERGIAETDQDQLHDCGIVYYPNQPYVLCVMTRGSDYDKLAGVIANISKIVYETIRGGGLSEK